MLGRADFRCFPSPGGVCYDFSSLDCNISLVQTMSCTVAGSCFPSTQVLLSVDTSPKSLQDLRETYEAHQELLCKPPVWVDLPVWFPEQVAQAHLAWGFGLPTCQATLSTLSLSALGPRRVVDPWVSPSALRTMSLGSCGYVGLVLNPWRLVGWMLAECRHHPPLSETWVGCGCWRLCSRLPHSRRSVQQAVPFLPMLQASFSTSRWYGSEFPRVLSRLCPQSIGPSVDILLH